MKKYLLELTVFISGAVVMVYELVGSRVFAPFLGTSLIVWTSLIGVILGSLSLGYWWGGLLADQQPRYKYLAFILTGAAFFVGTTVFFESLVLAILQTQVHDLRISSVIAAVVLFAPASILFGMVSPYAIRLKLESLQDSGAKIGGMYAISTVGSIVGTFLGGFFLVPFFGTIKIFFILILFLIINAVLILVIKKKSFKKKDLLILFFLISTLFLGYGSSAMGIKNVIDIDTQYNRVIIYEAIDHKTDRPIRVYTTDPHGAQSAIFLDQDNDLVFDYLKFYRLAKHFNPQVKTALMIGGGAFTYPRDFLRHNPEATIDVVEIDGELQKIAKKYFNFQEDPRITVYNQDGRIFLNENQKKYDVVFMDAFNSRFSNPFQLTTLEAVKSLYDLLSDKGVVLANIISAIEGDNGRFLRSEIATYKAVFPQVYIFPVAHPEDGKVTQNILLVASKVEKKDDFTAVENEEFKKQVSHYWKKEIDRDLPVLVDNYAPVEYYTMSAMAD